MRDMIQGIHTATNGHTCHAIAKGSSAPDVVAKEAPGH